MAILTLRNTCVRGALLSAAAIALLALLHARASTVDPQEHDRVQGHLRALHVFDAAVSEGVGRLLSEGGLDPASVRREAAAARARAEEAESGVPDFLGDEEARAEVKSAFRSAAAVFAAKASHLEAWTTTGDRRALRRALDVSARRPLEAAEAAYFRAYREAVREARFHGTCFAGLAVVLACGAAFSVVGLVRTRQRLGGAKEALEVQVEERTRALAESNESLRRTLEEMRQTEASLRESQTRYELAARGAHDGLWDWDLDQDFIYFSPRWKEMLGIDPETPCISPDAWFGRVHAEDVEGLRGALAEHLDPGTPHFEHACRMLHADGDYRWMLCRGLAVRDAAGRPCRMAGSQTDITRRVAAEERMRHDAHHDALTGLPNRHLFMDRLDLGLKRARRHPDRRCAVVVVGVDGTGVVNRSLGHDAGDALLRETARRLRDSLRDCDSVARIGGDEFAVLLEDLRDGGEAAAVAERIRRCLAYAGVSDEGDALPAVTVSMGIAVADEHRADPRQLLAEADAALRQAKSLGGDQAVGITTTP